MHTTNADSGAAHLVHKARGMAADMAERMAARLRTPQGPAAGPYTHEGLGRERGCPPIVLSTEQAEQLERSRARRHSAHTT